MAFSSLADTRCFHINLATKKRIWPSIGYTQPTPNLLNQRSPREGQPRFLQPRQTMGNSIGGRKHRDVIRLVARDDLDVVLDSLAEFSFGLADGHEVQHYMPPQFPLIPVLTKSRLQICQRTWELVQSAGTDKMKQYGKPGIVLFYDEFFYRLFERDMTFSLVFINVKQRGEVLIKALGFILAMKAEVPGDVDAMKNRCRFLGHKHRTYKGVRPHHFAAYTMTCIEVIMYWLGDEASPVVGEAWSNVVGFVLRFLLEPYLFCRTDPYESYQNTTIAAVREITESSATSATSMQLESHPSTRSLSSDRGGRNTISVGAAARPGDKAAGPTGVRPRDMLFPTISPALPSNDSSQVDEDTTLHTHSTNERSMGTLEME
ncbi:Aste57867_22517 [Aphanomyces stellatus]|uniref:Aste57867_22517 protein n=1 Tax=Aphanomyces stellatus TaxID=120398 RepID=A0A485LKK0_9STRA|nr:hypothetical protein As57867_022447 [Aphanomyces stellatus]VFT99177.1 Aste57867_22517 [Aphanomyces stellatus]